MYHELLVAGYSAHNVFRNGFGTDLTLDHHGGVPHNNLWTNIDLVSCTLCCLVVWCFQVVCTLPDRYGEAQWRLRGALAAKRCGQLSIIQLSTWLALPGPDHHSRSRCCCPAHPAIACCQPLCGRRVLAGRPWTSLGTRSTSLLQAATMCSGTSMPAASQCLAGRTAACSATRGARRGSRALTGCTTGLHTCRATLRWWWTCLWTPTADTLRR